MCVYTYIGIYTCMHMYMHYYIAAYIGVRPANSLYGTGRRGARNGRASKWEVSLWETTAHGLSQREEFKKLVSDLQQLGCYPVIVTFLEIMVIITII